MERRFISGEWEHIFQGRRAPTLTRVVYDRQVEQVAHCEIGDATCSRWRTATSDQMADIEDSLKNGNADLLESPDDYGLTESDDLPEWAGGRATA